MKKSSIILILVCLLSACVAPQPAIITPLPTIVPEKLTGEWLGGYIQPDGMIISIILNFTDAGGTLMIQPFGKTWNLSDFNQEETKVIFNVNGTSTDPFEEIRFEGEFINNEYAGKLHWDGIIYQIAFTQLTQIDSHSLEKYIGLYRFDSGLAVSVLLSPSYETGGLEFFPPGLMYTDFTTGDSRGLYPLEESTFGIGSARVLAYPLEGRKIKFIFNESGKVTGLQALDGIDETKIETAVRINYSVEDVKFTSADGEVMVGLLTSPETDKLHPAFMMLHGSEQGVKDGFGQQILAHYMVSNGAALLTYDKRGVGGSGGTYRESASESNIKLIASDAVAGVDYLYTRPEVDSARIGLIGGSQAGWVIPIAAAESDKLAFFVILSGPVVSVAHEDRYSSTTNDGDSAVNYDVEKLDQVLRSMNSSGVDPIPVLAELTQPGLWLWGSVDKSVPATVSAENLQTLIDSGKSNFSFATLQSGDHNLNESVHGYFAEIPYARRVLYFSKLTEWLEQNNIISKE
jgi:alpha/beta superfamily hydrolase